MSGRHLLHLARRLFGMIVPFGPSPADETWVREVLVPREHELWSRMCRADRRHAAGVARRVQRALGQEATPGVLAAALLHDVGKIDSGLGAYGRVVATVCGAVASDHTIDDWRRGRGFTRRVGLYLQHARIGSEMLALAGSHPVTVAWAREHHLPRQEWSIPPGLADTLKSADDD